MRIVNTVQNSKEWSEWRGTGLGASDAPVIMGDSPWTSSFELWTYKTKLCTRPEPHPNAVAAMQRGHELEPLARVLFEKQSGAAYPAVSAEHDTYPFIRASFDGYNAELNRLLEIKCPGKADHEKALKGKVPDKYRAQLQQQFLVSGATSGVYFSWDGKSETGVPIEVRPDPEYIARLLEALKHFWNRVELVIPPLSTRADLERLTNRLTKDIERVNMSLKALDLLHGALEGP